MINERYFKIKPGIILFKILPNINETIKTKAQIKLIIKLDIKGILILLVSYDKAAIKVSKDNANIKDKNVPTYIPSFLNILFFLLILVYKFKKMAQYKNVGVIIPTFQAKSYYRLLLFSLNLLLLSTDVKKDYILHYKCDTINMGEDTYGKSENWFIK